MDPERFDDFSTLINKRGGKANKARRKPVRNWIESFLTHYINTRRQLKCGFWVDSGVSRMSESTSPWLLFPPAQQHRSELWIEWTTPSDTFLLLRFLRQQNNIIISLHIRAHSTRQPSPDDGNISRRFLFIFFLFLVFFFSSLLLTLTLLVLSYFYDYPNAIPYSTDLFIRWSATTRLFRRWVRQFVHSLSPLFSPRHYALCFVCTIKSNQTLFSSFY